jgi:hypothetical protein
MSTPNLRYLVAGVPFVHGVGHLLGFWMPAPSWLLPGMKERVLRVVSRDMGCRGLWFRGRGPWLLGVSHSG